MFKIVRTGTTFAKNLNWSHSPIIIQKNKSTHRNGFSWIRDKAPYLTIAVMAKWEKLSHLEHVLKRPDSYIGSVQSEHQPWWTVEDSDTFVSKDLKLAPGILKVFDEILVNALDQNALHPDSVTKIQVEVDGNEIKVINNGPGIPCTLHESENIPVPELIFGHLLTSSNYDDTTERTTGGRNGYGSKLTNIYSKYFKVEVKDPVNKLHFKKTWKNNMQTSDKTSIATIKDSVGGMVKIVWEPDWERFGMDGMNNDLLAVIEKRTWDAALCTSPTCKVRFNGKTVNVRSPSAYLNMHGSTTLARTDKIPGWDVCVGLSDGFRQVSWVNGICTTKGGTHIDAITGGLAKAILAARPKLTLKSQDIKNHLFVLVKATVGNPSFSSQAKTECTKKIVLARVFHTQFQSMAKTLLKNGLGDELDAMASFKESRNLKKTDGTKKSRVQVAKLDDANWAGTARSDQCTLIVTEGDSAKALAIAGLSEVGRDKFGVFPLRGKPRNVRDVAVKTLMTNQEFSDLKKILGLQQDKEYKSLAELRYGRLMVMTDADVDGTHIKGLLLNMIHCFWPSLLDLGFVVSMITPVIKVSGMAGGTKSFFTDVAYRQWLEENGPLPPRATVKYYKGLGTSTSKDAKDYFRSIGQLTVGFDSDDNTDKAILLAFDKTKADDRKVWLQEKAKNLEATPTYGSIKSLTIDQFIQTDLVNFSLADNVRSIPHLMDGLKPSQRKVMFACFKRNLQQEMKVAQLSGYVSEHTAYHHGEASLQGTIVGLAQDFVGSNNINLLEPCGQFGSRLMNGKDSASPRYIFTRLTPQTRKIFSPMDDQVLKYLEDDGKSIEPEYYAPVIPMVLVNGAEGIGTGFSTTIPSFNPLEIRSRLHQILMEGDQAKLAELNPWYKGFQGTIEKKDSQTWVLSGVMKVVGSKIEINELPPGLSTQDFKEHLDKLVTKGTIKNYTNHSTEDTVKVQVAGYDGNDAYKDLHLLKTVRTSNMHLWSPYGGIKKYNSPLDIIREFAKRRLGLFKDRKAHVVDVLERRAAERSTRADFITKVVNEEIIVFKRPKKELKTEIMTVMEVDAKVADTLLDIKTHQYTHEAIHELQEQAQRGREQLRKMQKTSIRDMWEGDLEDLKLKM